MRRAFLTSAVLLVAALLSVPAWAGGQLPDFRVKGNLTRAQAEYLGLGDPAAPFNFSDVKTEFILLNVFSLYCGPCQRDAPHLNEMYDEIEAMGLAGRIKFLGLAAGNSPGETELWRSRFKVEFPLIPDRDYALHKGLGEVSTPYFVLARIAGPGRLDVLFAQEGAVEDKDAFFEDILALAAPGLARR